MPNVAVIGEEAAVAVFTLAGATMETAVDPTDIRRAWQRVADDAQVIILSSAAAAVLEEEIQKSSAPLTVVLP